MKILFKKILLVLATTIGFVWASDNMNGMDMSNMKDMSSSAHAKMKNHTKQNSSGISVQK